MNNEKSIQAIKMDPVEITITTWPDTSEPMAKKIIPAKPTKSNLQVTKEAARLAFPVYCQAIKENTNTSNHLAILVRKPATKRSRNVLKYQISFKR